MKKLSASWWIENFTLSKTEALNDQFYLVFMQKKSHYSLPFYK